MFNTIQRASEVAGLDLAGTRSKAELLEAVSRRTREVRGRAILGHGWDETQWPVREIPTAAELDRASYGSVVYLSRVDVHSALASSALMASVSGLESLELLRADIRQKLEARRDELGAQLQRMRAERGTEHIVRVSARLRPVAQGFIYSVFECLAAAAHRNNAGA